MVEVLEKPKSESPESIPSLAESSLSSSNDGDEEVSRILFVKDTSEKQQKRQVVENIHKLSEDDSKEEPEEETAISVTSSETTPIASWNLSPKNNADEKLSTSQSNDFLFGDTSITQNSSDEDDEDEGLEDDDAAGAFPSLSTPKTRKIHITVVQTAVEKSPTPPKDPLKEPPMIMEDPPTESGTCNRAALGLTPRQLSELFLSFESKPNIWPTRQGEASKEDLSDTLLAVPSFGAESVASVRATASRWIDGWMPNNETIDNECSTLKKIIKHNSVKLFNLRQAVEAQRELNALKEVEIVDKEIELKNLHKRLDALEKEKEVSQEREQELFETINILKSEVDKLTQIKTTKKDDTASEPYDQVNDLYSQILEQEVVIAKLRKKLEEKQEEICKLAIEQVESCSAETPTEQPHSSESLDDLLLQELVEGEDIEKKFLSATMQPCQPSLNEQSLRSKIPEFTNNLERKDRVNQLNPSRSIAPEDRSLVDSKYSDIPYNQAAATELRDMLASISKRLEAFEYENQLQETDAIVTDIEKTENAIEEIIRHIQAEEELRKTVLEIGQEVEEIEVMLEKDLINKQNISSSEKCAKSCPAPPDDTGLQACCCWSSAITGDLE
jgi:hypothetical protein